MRLFLYFLLILSLFVNQRLKACDVCGSSGFSQSLGFLPGFQRSFVGTSWSNGSFQSNHPVLNSGDIAGSSTENYHKFEVRGRYVINNKWQVMAFVPFGFFQKKDSGIVTKNSGLSDIAVSINYLILDKNNKGKRNVFFAGAGIKAPTGNNSMLDNKYQIWIPNMQLGTGSWDFIFNVNYIYTNANNIGLIAETYGKINTQNSMQYQFGNLWTGSLRGFKKFYFKEEKHTIIPSIGAGSEWMGQDKRFGLLNKLSGGYSMQLQAGLDYFVSDFNFSFLYSLPILYQLSDGNVTPNQAFRLSITYLL